MNKISFSHVYSKLTLDDYHTISSAKLIQTLIVNLEDLSYHFKQYDTDRGKFKLPESGKYIMLMFLKDNNKNIFTTLRSYTGSKYEYYNSKVGQEFQINLEGELCNQELN